MKKYNISFIETIRHNITIESSSIKEAQLKLNCLIQEMKVNLAEGDPVSIEIEHTEEIE